MKNNATIEYVYPGSIAALSGIKSGERLNSINGHVLRDMIDYQYLSADSYLTVEVEDAAGTIREIEIDKEDDDDLGIAFQSAVFDGMRKCCNHCIFCFIDQMIKGQRETLYVKDDDYRLSFLYGNYITLTNLKDEDFERIKKQRLSPLYISVHCLDEEMRKTILGRRDKRPFRQLLKELSDSGIEMHGQIVLVPGYNDGDYLKETIEGIAAIEGFCSLALVPVGLTKAKNPLLKPYNGQEAAKIIELTTLYQKEFLAKKGTRFLYAADEFYLLAGAAIPGEEAYEDYPQLENGIGLTRRFTEDYFYAAEELLDFKTDKKIGLITAHHGAESLEMVIDDLNHRGKLHAEPLTVENTFFGSTVTVTGLLTGEDIIKTLLDKGKKDTIYLLPDVLLKHNTDLLLDGVSVCEIATRSGCNILVTETDGAALVKMINRIREETL